ncbi:Altered inheritance of mitochondria protein 6 [Pleurostoma richardsiae]|uniref:Altered inheritance of mitochondria protein 6 n=1 Tax=Pleurostoma richardsiae TaxID=41990 RepID=A0AA38VDN9_9PEZI|nr:Altered inheritance of mitochondria protein 6 [Pleurostoma richardsiae]
MVLLLLGASVSVAITALWQRTRADPFDVAFAQFWRTRFTRHSLERYPAEFFGNIIPFPCHSHNDYWRRTPLFAALGSGCVSIEADVWLENEDLYVAHTHPGIRENATLQNMYTRPLARVLDTINPPLMPYEDRELRGFFYNDPAQTLTLLVDFKSPSNVAWSVFHNNLQPLRDRGWLTHWNGTARITRPITVVASGAVDFDLLAANQSYRDVFYDAPLDALEHESDGSSNGLSGDVFQRFKYNPSNSHFASAKFARAIGPLWGSSLSDRQIEELRRQIRNARERQLIPRYWGTPRWPRGLRDAIWTLLVREEVGLLNVDDLRAVRKGVWGLWPQGGS